VSKQIVRINLWSSPRNVSTAFLYAFGERPDVEAFDEPLYAHYLTHAQAGDRHPAREAILASQLHDGAAVVEQLVLGPSSKDILFFKQMTHHLVDMDWSFMTQTRNLLFIRNPREIIASYAKVIPLPTLDDIGIALQVKLLQYLQEREALTAVIDAADLLRNPGRMLEAICAACGIPYLPQMLHWKSGPKPYDGVWAPHWYAEVHRSEGFRPYTEREFPLADHLEELAATCVPYHAKLMAQRLRV